MTSVDEQITRKTTENNRELWRQRVLRDLRNYLNQIMGKNRKERSSK